MEGSFGLAGDEDEFLEDVGALGGRLKEALLNSP